MRFHFLYLVSLLAAAPIGALHAEEEATGPLDRPISAAITHKNSSTSLIPSDDGSVATSTPIQAQEELRQEVVKEQDELAKLDRDELEEKAEHGERAAQVVLGTEFAKEASQLAFAPAAANDALSDAARWYSLAASRGFPGAPSLDQAGVRFYPIRIQREFRN